jgi:hypothetical protein
MRTRFKVTSVETEVHVAENGETYVWGRATDGTKFEGVLMTFPFWFSPEEPVHVDDIISGEFSDPSSPSVIHNVFVEARPTLFVEPEPLQLPEPPAPPVVEPQHDELAFAIQSGYGLSQGDVGALGRRFLKLEAQFHEHVKTCGCR